MHEQQTLRYTREQFYEKLWSTPTTKVAKELGCSDVLVGKICKDYLVPKPYLGYWAKLEHGKNPKKTPLPMNTDPAKQMLTFHKYPKCQTTISEPTQEPEYDPDIRDMLERARALEPVRVADALRKPHPLLAATRDRIKAMRAAEKVPFCDRRYDTRVERAPTVSIEVSKNMTIRALCIMDALVKRVEKIGGTIQIRKDKWNEWKTHTVVFFGGEEVSLIRLREKQNQVRIPAGKDRWSHARTELEPSGLLILDRGPTYLESVLLRDTPKTRRIEDGLSDLIIGFVKKAGQTRIERRADEEAAKRRAEEERVRRQQEEELRQRREDLARRQKAEQARVNTLIDHANSWRQSRIIRDYLTALSNMLISRDGAIAVDGEAADYLRWACQQADRLDPLRPSPPSVLDEVI